MRTLVLSTLLLLSSIVNAQTSTFQIAWEKTYGGSLKDVATKVKATSDGGLIVVGSSASTSGDKTTSLGNTDIWVVKLDSIGTIEWEKSFGNSGEDAGTDILETTTNDFILIGNVTDVANSRALGTAIKISTSGAILWEKIFDSQNPNRFNSITKTTDGNYVIGGSKVVPSGTGVRGNYYVIKINNAGDIIWEKIWGADNMSENVTVVTATSDGGVIIGAQGYPLSIIFVSSIMKLDEDGLIQWTKTFPPITPSMPNPSQIVAIINAYNGYMVLRENETGYNTKILRIDNIGTTIWEKSFPRKKITTVTNTASNNIILGGLTDISGNGRTDALLMELNSVGDKILEKTFGGSNFDYIYSVTTYNNDLIFAGSSSSADFDVSNNKGDDDYWVARIATITEPLSVNFGNLSAYLTNERLTVNWQTLSETSNSHFEVEVSKDGKKFSSIGEVVSKAAGGNSANTLEYNFESPIPSNILWFVPLVIGSIALSQRKKWKTNTLLCLLGLFLMTCINACGKKDLITNTDYNSLYIKIKQIDIDGVAKYSKTIKISKD